MSLANKDEILILYMAKLGEALHNKKDQELYAYFFGKVPRNAMLRDAIDAAIRQEDGTIDYQVLRVESENEALLKIVIGNLAVIYNKHSGKKAKPSRKSSSSSSRSSRSSSRAVRRGPTHMPMQMPMPMPIPMQMPQMNFRGRKNNSTGEGIELVSLNSLRRMPKGRTTRRSSKRTSSKTSSSKGIEMVEFNKGRKRRTTSSPRSSSRRKSSRKGRKVSNKPYDEVLSLTETGSSGKRGSLSLSSSSASSPLFQNLEASPSSSTKRRTSLRELEESLSLSPLTASPGRASTKRRGG